MNSTKKNIPIPLPYDEMMDELKGVGGYEDFVKFVQNRSLSTDHFKAEVKALFEINKKQHPLTKICSQDNSAPEGIFRIGSTSGFIEAAYIDPIFDKTKLRKTVINRITNTFHPVIKKIIQFDSNYQIKVILQVLKDIQEKNLLIIKKQLVEKLMQGKKRLLSKTRD